MVSNVKNGQWLFRKIPMLHFFKELLQQFVLFKTPTQNICHKDLETKNLPSKFLMGIALLKSTSLEYRILIFCDFVK